jgi:hypothetical protein
MMAVGLLSDSRATGASGSPVRTACCLVWNGREEFYAGASWLQYLIDHFLRRGAKA